MPSEQNQWWSPYALTAFSAFIMVASDILRRIADRKFQDLSKKDAERENEEQIRREHRRYPEVQDEESNDDEESLP